MLKIIMKGKFITFEGCESCGKTTQAKMLYDFLKGSGLDIIFLREPGGSLVSEKIRAILLDPRNKNLTDSAELLLYMASRAQTVKEVIEPALGSGKIVLCDRFLDSTLTYQGYGLGLPIKFIKLLGAFATGGIQPDLTILLDVPLKKALGGINRAKDRIEQREYAYHLRVKKGYLALAKQEPDRIKVVALEREKIATHKKIRKLALDVIKSGAL
jgi:dTMP kinase